MAKWRCTVCGYVHEDQEPPEHCPVCGADRSRFVSADADEAAISRMDAGKLPTASPTAQRWQCAVCESVHTDAAPPATCPVCGSEQHHFNPILDGLAAGAQSHENQDNRAGDDDLRWQCSVCGYLHTGSEPPANCPVCGAEKSQLVRLDTDTRENKPEKVLRPTEEDTAGKVEQEPLAAAQSSAAFWEPYRRWIDLVIAYHAHPIGVHIPNGVLPVTVFMVFLAAIFDWPAIGNAGVYNMGFIFISMPVVLFTGYLHWQFKFGGNMTNLFKWKIICGGAVLLLSLILFGWGLISPETARHPSAVYLLLHLIMLSVAGVAGWLGGKLVFRPRT